MPAPLKKLAPALAVLAGAGLASAQSITTTAGPSRMTSEATLKLAKTYSGNSFFDGFNFETAADPTGGYVNYVSQDYARSEGLINVQADGAVIMRVDAEQRATGRGRDSVRISSKNEYADGVYILDLNHMPVGCGVWPAWWTTIKTGWPTGGEIDILEGANTLPSRYGRAWNATGNITAPTTLKTTRNTGSLHTNFNCTLDANPYMTGSLGADTCSAFVNGNMGCGATMGGNTTYGIESFGSQVNDVAGGWYALWRDMAGSGGAYVYFWPRNATNVPNDVRYANSTTTNVQNWGQPGVNLTAPGCKDDFGNHVIVFNMALCGDYSAATWGSSGCPTTQSCPTFVMNNPGAFAETYWSINSLRVYTASGSAATTQSAGLTTAQIGGIAGGVAGFVILCALLFWRYRVVKKKRAVAARPDTPNSEDEVKQHNQWATPDELPPLTGVYVPDPTKQRRASSIPILATAKPRTGRTSLAPGKTARHQLEGETAAGFYHSQATSLDSTPNASSLAISQIREQGSAIGTGSAVESRPMGARSLASAPDKTRLSVNIGVPAGSTSSAASRSPTTPRRGSTYGRPESRSFTPTTSSFNRRDSGFQGERSGGSWVG